MASKNLKTALAIIAFGATTAGTMRDANANEVSFCRFTDLNQTTIQLNGAQALTELVNLTPNLPNQAGSAYVKTPMTLGPLTSFGAHFRFRLYPNTGGTGGAGLAFVLQNKSLTAGSGSGGGLGLNGVSPSVAVEFDTAQDANGDPNANHVAVIVDGRSTDHLAVATPAFNMKNGVLTDAWVEYVAPSKTLTVYIAQGTNGAKPPLPLLTHVIDVYAATKAGQNGNKVIVGFSGATGNTETNSQDVTYLVVGTGPLPTFTDCIPCASDAQCPVGQPACQPNGFCGECSANNAALCVAPRPFCNPDVGQCVECTSSAQCSGNKPICQNNVCVPCTSDFGGAAPACPTANLPVCQVAGPTSGSCTQCAPGNAAQCAQPQPVCLPDVGTCGCVADADCGGPSSGLICAGQPAACVPGCRTTPNTGNVCPAGQTCTPTPGAPNTGTCNQPCANGCAAPTPVCNAPADTCVQCLTTADCQGNQVCNPATNTCGDCVPGGDVSNCVPGDTGSACRPNGQCGCDTDADCGNVTSGRVCDDATKVCRAGCRGTGGNKCSAGDVCTSTTTAIGQCVTDVGDAGVDAGVLADGGADAGRDAGRDGGTTTPDGSVVPRPDASADGGDGALLDDFSIEGGGCACSTLGAGSPALSFGSFGVTALAIGALLRRRRRS